MTDNETMWVIIHVTNKGEFVISGIWLTEIAAHAQTQIDDDPNCVKHMVREINIDPASDW